MCGILALLRASDCVTSTELWERGGKLLQARGPEEYTIKEMENGTWIFTRLAINGLNSGGQQPFVSACDTLTWMCNGEIYNSVELSKRLQFKSKSGSFDESGIRFNEVSVGS